MDKTRPADLSKKNEALVSTAAINERLRPLFGLLSFIFLNPVGGVSI
jgi:hypothetical protein